MAIQSVYVSRRKLTTKYRLELKLRVYVVNETENGSGPDENTLGTTRKIGGSCITWPIVSNLVSSSDLLEFVFQVQFDVVRRRLRD